MRYTHTLEHYVAWRGEKNYSPTYDMDEPGRHYAKGIKPASER